MFLPCGSARIPGIVRKTKRKHSKKKTPCTYFPLELTVPGPHRCPYREGVSLFVPAEMVL